MNMELINFTQLNDTDKIEILQWRNSIDIKKWMYNTQDISKNDHLKFIESLKTDNKKQYFLLLKQNIKVGVVYFTDITTQCCKFGLYSSPKVNKVGKILMDAICQYAFHSLGVHKLIAEVFSDNLKAINLYKQYDFKKVSTKTINNKTVILMELYNENR